MASAFDIATLRSTDQISCFTLDTNVSGGGTVLTTMPRLNIVEVATSGTNASGPGGCVMPSFLASATTPIISNVRSSIPPSPFRSFSAMTLPIGSRPSK